MSKNKAVIESISNNLSKYYKKVKRCSHKGCNRLYGLDNVMDDNLCPIHSVHSSKKYSKLLLKRENEN